jgi:hypothetical protein
MKVLATVLLVSIPAYLLQFYLPWWSLSVWAGLVGFMLNQKNAWGFLGGLLGGALLWGGFAAYHIFQGEGYMTHRMAMNFGVPSFVLWLATAMIGGITAGLGLLSGRLLRQFLDDSFQRKKSSTAPNA